MNMKGSTSQQIIWGTLDFMTPTKMYILACVFLILRCLIQHLGTLQIPTEIVNKFYLCTYYFFSKEEYQNVSWKRISREHPSFYFYTIWASGNLNKMMFLNEGAYFMVFQGQRHTGYKIYRNKIFLQNTFL